MLYYYITYRKNLHINSVQTFSVLILPFCFLKEFDDAEFLEKLFYSNLKMWHFAGRKSNAEMKNADVDPVTMINLRNEKTLPHGLL